jgi:hypothetical protein
MKKVALIIFIIMLIIALVHNRTNILMFLKSIVNLLRVDGRLLRTMTLKAYKDEDIISEVLAEVIYYDEERKYVIINEKGKHIPPHSLRTIKKYLFKFAPIYWFFHLRELEIYADEVMGFVLCDKQRIEWSPNIVIPPREEWLNERYMDELIEILSIDNNTMEVYEVEIIKGEEFPRKRWVKPYRFQELIRKSNPKFWNENKNRLLLEVSIRELNKISKCFDGEKLVL